MKKLLLLSILSVSVVAVFGQDGFSYGVKVGAGVSRIHQEFARNGSNPRWGPVAGLFVYDWFPAKQMGLQLEVLYSERGGRYGTQSWSYDCIDVPLLLKIKLTGGADLNVGGQYSYLFNTKEKGKKVEPQTAPGYRDHEISIVCGVSLDMTRHLFLDGRVALGTKPLRNIDLRNRKKIYSSTAALTLGARF